MIVCPGCSGRNEPDANTCTFCKRRLAVSVRTAERPHGPSGTPGTAAGLPAATVRKVLLAALVLLILLVGILLFVLRSSQLGRAG